MTMKTTKPIASRSLTATIATAFFTLSMVVLLVSSGLQLYTNFKTQQTSITDRQQLIAQEASKTVSNFIQEKFTTLETSVAFTNPIIATPDARASFLASLLGINPAFRQFALLSAEGTQLAQISRIAPKISSQFSTQLNAEMNTQMSNQQHFISTVYIDDTTSEPLITVAIPVINNLGEFEGTLAAEVNLKFMWNLVDQLRVGNTGYAYVVDNTGTLLAFRDTALVLQGKNTSQINEVSAFINNPLALSDITPEVKSYTGLNGSTVLGTYAPIGTPQWAVIIEMPWQEAYQDLVSQGIVSGLIILGMAILASLAGIFSARRLATPLINLTNTANRITEGQLELQANPIGPTEIASLATAFNSMTSQMRNLIDGLEQRIAERTADVELARLHSEYRAQELEAIGEISTTISTEQRLNILLPLVTRLVSERFDFYHTGIFFVDETKQFAILEASNSQGGKRMLERGHRLEVGLTGIVGTVAKTGKSRIALDVGADATFFDNPDLPETRSEMALPLNIRGETIGVLDVQSTKPGAFTESDANTLSILADQVAIAIDNARLFSQTQQAREEAENLYNQFLRTEWGSFVQKEATIGYKQSAIGGAPIAKPVDTQEIRDALQNGRISVADGKDLKALQPSIAVPVKLRGQTIGVINIKAPTKDRKWNQDEVNLAEAISDRLALALDNARLLQESQRRASKEAKIGEVTARIGASINMRNVLQTAVEELGRALPGSEVIIQFQESQEK